MNIYVGNLSYKSSERTIQEAFEEFGSVVKANIITDRETGRSKGFGFVEMSNDEEGQRAIEEMDGRDLDGRNLKVNEARPREERPRSGGGRSFGGDRGGDRGGRRNSW